MAKIIRLWHYLMPFATDSTGVCSLFCDADAVVIGMDPGATAVRCYSFTEQRDDQKARYKGMQIGELDVVMGKMDEILDRLRDLTGEERAEFIILVGTPVASMVGADLKALARQFEKTSRRTVMGFPTTGNRYYDEGLSEAFLLIYERLQKESAQHFSEKSQPGRLGGIVNDPFSGEEESPQLQQTKKINLLGFDTLDFPDPQQRWNLLQHLEKHHLQVTGIWGIHSSESNWRLASEADLNVVCTASGYRLAVRMKKDSGIPFLFLDELLEDTAGLETISGNLPVPDNAHRILIIGEQVTSCVLRRQLRCHYRERDKEIPEILHAGFFLMHSPLMDVQDIRLKSENELRQLVTEKTLDLIIGDPMYRLIADPSIPYISRIHPPVSGGFAEQLSVF